ACNRDDADWNGDLAANLLAKLAADQGRSGEALQFFTSLESRAKNEVALTCRLYRALLLSRDGRHDEAIAIYRAVRADDMDQITTMNLVIALCRAGRYDEARVTASNLDQPWVDYADGHIHEARGRTSEAARAYRRFLHAAPQAGPFPADP